MQYAIRIIILSVSILATLTIIGQPLPCNVANPEMQPTCAEACIICDIDGFSGRHQSDIPGVLPPDFCTFVVHNAQWIAFQAASTNLSIELSVSNCDIGSGLEVTIYRSLDCENFEMISNCFGAVNAIAQGSSDLITVTEELVIGQYYYLAMDGALADNCDWTFSVIEGSTEIDALTVSAPIQGSDRICPETTHTYSSEPEVGAVIFDWTLNGQPIGDNTLPEVDLTLTDLGVYTLCLTASNACDEAAQTCTVVEVAEIPVDIITQEFCQGECYQRDGREFCESGIFEYTIALANGCDSSIVLNLTELEQPINDLTLFICEGDTLYVGDTPLFETGQYSETLVNDFLCDSIVNVDLQLVICNLVSEGSTTSIRCNGEQNGMLNFSVQNGTPPFNYVWQHLQTGLMGSGDMVSLAEVILIENLPKGTVIFEVVDGFGNGDITIAEIVEPDPIELSEIITDYNGFGITCTDNTDGAIELRLTGGQAPYNFDWSTGEQTPSVANLAAGTYSITITDELGCEMIQTYEIREPDPLNPLVQFTDPDCDGLSSGQVEIISTEGGAPGYTYSLDGGPFTSAILFDGLAPGMHQLVITDTNNCQVEITEVLVAPEIPQLFGETNYSTTLGCEIEFSVTTNDINIQQVAWADSSYLACNNCLITEAIPLVTGNNTIVVTSMDGCSDSLTLSIEVESLREFYAPNAFSPNGDGINEVFNIFGGKEVDRIDLTIYDRWGEKIYAAMDMAPLNPADAWDGRYNGRQVVAGVYVWTAELHFIDGVSEIYDGSVSVIR